MNIQIEKTLHKSVNHVILKPSPELLENWKIWIALEMLEQLKHGVVKNTTLFDANTVVDRIENSKQNQKFSRLQEMIDRQALILRKECNSFKELIIAREKLEEFYLNNVLSEVEKIGQNINNIEISVFKKAVNSKACKVGPAPMLSWLKKLFGSFLDLKNQHDKNKIYYLGQEAAAFRAFNNLAKVDNASWKTNVEESLSNIWNSVVVGIKSMLLVEKHRILSQIFFDLMQICQIYTGYSESSIALLQRIKKSLSKEASVDLVSLPIFGYMKKLDASKQQKMLEIWTGHCINHWGNAPVSWVQIKNRLLVNLNPVVSSIFDDFQHCFIEYVSIEESQL